MSLPFKTKQECLIGSATFAVVAVGYVIYKKWNNTSDSSTPSYLLSEGIAKYVHQENVKPPLPPIVQSLLANAHLCYLSTSDMELRSSHLSLMRFTYLSQDEVIILSTSRNTKKFDLLKKQRGVALLVHDFGSNSPASGTYSITLNGDCSIVEDTKDLVRYRKAHLDHNPDYPQFIVGDDIAILCVNVQSARICDINDNVKKWNVNHT